MQINFEFNGFKQVLTFVQESLSKSVDFIHANIQRREEFNFEVYRDNLR